MSTEALEVEKAIDMMLDTEPAEEAVEPVQEEVETEVEETEVEAEETEEVDSEVDDSEYDESDDDEYEANDESAENDDEPEQVEPSKFTVKVDGEEVEVTLDDLKRSYSGQGKIQKGMQEAAEMRKQAQAAQQQAMQIAQQMNAMYQQRMEKGVLAQPEPPSRELFDSDPIGYMEAKMDYDAKLAEFQQQEQEQQYIQQMNAQQQMAANQQRLAQEAERLKEQIPELRDAKTASQFLGKLVQAGTSDYGFTEEEVRNISDSRAMLVLRDAMRWRESQSKKSQVEKKAQKARPVIKPQAKKVRDPNQKKLRDAKARLKKSGRIDDAADLLLM